MLNNSVELLEHAIDYAKKRGFRVRTEALAGATSGSCRIGSTGHIFLDQSTTADQQLAEIMKYLKKETRDLAESDHSPTNPPEMPAKAA